MGRDLITKATSIVMALGIVGGAVWLMSTQTQTVDSTNSVNTQSKNTAATEIAQTTKAYKKDRSYGTNLGIQSTSELAASGGIVKCESGGKVTYSDKGCKPTDRQVIADIRETSGGFVSPDAQTIADTRTQIRAEIRQPGFVAMAGESAPAMTSNTQGQCYYLNEEIKSIDSASNIGQSGWSQDQLRLRRLDVRNRMYRLSC